ncbi:hypothetical protein [Candidatus Avelusimicrobium alvi]|uniref:hypothetical protein n=1 Tax=Candidatus Avelusimicrobium alvi TaxID=3416221 RepID=UPI003D130B3D
MKRIFIALSLLCVPLLAFSENKIKMVTYFPVPYVAYSKINASKQLDIGLTSACEMNLGCSESGALGIRPLQATTVNLNRGKLDLNTAAAVKSTNVALGSGSGEANIDFSANLRIGTLNNGYSLEATDMNVSSLTLFRSHMSSDSAAKFPSCAATGASGAPQVSWQKVKLKNAEEVYLVCGSPAVSDGCIPEALYVSTTREELQALWGSNRESFCSVWYKGYKYQCPSGLTEPKRCVDSYYTTGGGAKSAYFTKQMKSIVNAIPNTIAPTLGFYDTVHQFYGDQLTKHYMGEPIKEWIMIQEPTYPQVDVLAQKVVGFSEARAREFCATLTYKEPGEYGLYLSNVFTITNEYDSNLGGTYFYMIEAGYCAIREEDSFYRADVTCCP